MTEWYDPNVRLPEKDGYYICYFKIESSKEPKYRIDVFYFGDLSPYEDLHAYFKDRPGYLYGNKAFGELWDDGVDNPVIALRWTYPPAPPKLT